jgi:hypothetical protein
MAASRTLGMGKKRAKRGKAKKVVTVNLGKKKGSFKVHKGRLHRALGIPEGQPIPKSRLRSALKSKDPSIRAMARSAYGLEGMSKKR